MKVKNAIKFEEINEQDVQFNMWLQEHEAELLELYKDNGAMETFEEMAYYIFVTDGL